MSKKREELLKQYEGELLKQTSPYDYYVNTTMQKREGHDRSHESLSCGLEIIEALEEINWKEDEKKELEKLKCSLEGYKIACAIINNNTDSLKRGNKQDSAINNPCEQENGKEAASFKITQLPDYLLIYQEDTTPDIGVIKEECERLKGDLIYFDEDFLDIETGKRYAPFFKPDYSPDTLMSNNYIGTMALINYKLVVKMIREGKLEDSKGFYDLLLRVDEESGSAEHIARIGSHTSRDLLGDEIGEACQKVYDEYVQVGESDENADIIEKAKLRRHYAMLDKRVSLSIIIPSKNNSEMLTKCLDSIKIKGGFNKYRYFGEITGDDESKTEKRFSQTEVIVVDNGSNIDEKNKIAYAIKKMNKDAERAGNDFSAKYIFKEMDFNFSKMCNIGAKAANGDYLMFMNDDVEVVDEEAIYRMCEYASMDKVGTVGAKLYYPDGRLIQHCGITDLDAGPSHKLSHHDDEVNYYYGMNRFNRNVLACTAACIIIGKEKYFNIGGFNDKMKVGYNDVDLALKALEADYRNVLLNDVCFFHHESYSRGVDAYDDVKYARLKEERTLMYNEHPWLKEKGDPFYNANLISDTLDYSVNVIPKSFVRSYRSTVKVINKAIKANGPVNKILGRYSHFNSESVTFERGIMQDENDYFRFTGWALVEKINNAFLQREFVLIDEADKKTIVAEALPVYREDVTKVFENAENAYLAGYACNIDAKYIDDNKTYRMGFVFKDLVTGLKYIVLGDNYERTGSNPGITE